MLDLSKCVAVITGGASGIARAVARQLGREGVKTIGVVDFSDAVTGVCAEINRELGRECLIAYRGDVTDNAFQTLPGWIGELHSLTEFRAYNNQLSTLPDEIGDLSQLRELHVMNNALTTLPAALERRGQRRRVRAL